MPVRAGAALALLLTVSVGCRSFDPEVFDRRLRRATFDAYVEAIGTQFGGLDAADVTVEELEERYRETALEAGTPAEFYGAVRAMLADLDDPHATLRVSPRFWVGPVAEPEWLQLVMSRGQVWAGVPERSVRTAKETDVAITSWLTEQGADSPAELEALGIAHFLRSSAAYGPDEEAAREPLVWFPLRAVDGQRVETAHDAELLARGSLGSVALFDVAEHHQQQVPSQVALVRNAGVFEDDGESDSGVRRRLNPLELAAPWIRAERGARGPEAARLRR